MGGEHYCIQGKEDDLIKVEQQLNWKPLFLTKLNALVERHPLLVRTEIKNFPIPTHLSNVLSAKRQEEIKKIG